MMIFKFIQVRQVRPNERINNGQKCSGTNSSTQKRTVIQPCPVYEDVADLKCGNSKVIELEANIAYEPIDMSVAN